MILDRDAYRTSWVLAMFVVPLLNFGKCLEAYFVLKLVLVLSDPEVRSVLPEKNIQ